MITTKKLRKSKKQRPHATAKVGFKSKRLKVVHIPSTKTANPKFDTPTDIYWAAPRAMPNANWPPHTDSKARPCDWIAVKSAKVVRVRGGKFRDASLNGAFAIDENCKQIKKDRVSVLCRWYGHRVEKHGPLITIDPKKCCVDPNYTGYVVTNLHGLKKPPSR